MKELALQILQCRRKKEREEKEEREEEEEMEVKERMEYVDVLRYENKNYCTEGLIKKNETERRRV